MAFATEQQYQDALKRYQTGQRLKNVYAGMPASMIPAHHRELVNMAMPVHEITPGLPELTPQKLHMAMTDGNLESLLDPYYASGGIDAVRGALQKDPQIYNSFTDIKDTGSGYELTRRVPGEGHGGLGGLLMDTASAIGKPIKSVVDPIGEAVSSVMKPVGSALHDFADAAIGPAIQLGAGALLGTGIMSGIGSLGAGTGSTGATSATGAAADVGGGLLGPDTYSLATASDAAAAGHLGLQAPAAAAAPAQSLTHVGSFLGENALLPAIGPGSTSLLQANLAPPPNALGSITPPVSPPINVPTASAPAPAPAPAPAASPPPEIVADLTFDPATNSFSSAATAPGTTAVLGASAFPGAINSPGADEVLNAPLDPAPSLLSNPMEWIKENPMQALSALGLLGSAAGVGQPDYSPPPQRTYPIGTIPKPALPNYGLLGGMDGPNMEMVNYAPGLVGARLTPQFTTGLLNRFPGRQPFIPSPN